MTKITKCANCPNCDPSYSQISLYCSEMLRQGLPTRIANIDIQPIWCPLSDKKEA